MLILPPSLNQQPQPSALDASGRRVVIVGANGAGKSRFAERLIATSEGITPFRISALNALYNSQSVADPLAGSIDSLYAAAAERSAFLRSDVATQFDRLMTLLLVDEMSSLLDSKLAGNSSRPGRLDAVVRAWQDTFPDSRVLCEGGRMLFERTPGEAYSPVKLSDGEKAVMYYFAAVQYAPPGATVFVDAPCMFLHTSITTAIWDRVESMRPDCTFIYTTHDIDFISSRRGNIVVWVRNFDAVSVAWDYVVLPPEAPLSDELCRTIIGARKPVLFIEGDSQRSIDAKLYPLVFTDYTVRSLGSCNKVIEATRTFNDLNALHHLDSHGIVDRDRRDACEVDYLRRKKVFVPDVAEIENILMLEEVIRAVASSCNRDEDKVFAAVKRSIIKQFRNDLRQQALLHTRHRVKRLVECRIDARFSNITQLEQHMVGLIDEIKPRQLFQKFCSEFHNYLATDDYASVLCVYNKKSMVPESNVATLCGLSGKDAYVGRIIKILRSDAPQAARIRSSIIACFGISVINDNED